MQRISEKSHVLVLDNELNTTTGRTTPIKSFAQVLSLFRVNIQGGDVSYAFVRWLEMDTLTDLKEIRMTRSGHVKLKWRTRDAYNFVELKKIQEVVHVIPSNKFTTRKGERFWYNASQMSCMHERVAAIVEHIN